MSEHAISPELSTYLMQQQAADQQGDAMRAAVAALLSKFAQVWPGELGPALLYGSCRRSGDPFDGVVDLYVVVPDRNGEPRVRAWFGSVLPPNVYYIEASVADGASQGTSQDGSARTVRAKVGVFTWSELDRGVGWLHPYVWGRLAQPFTVFPTRTDAAQQCQRERERLVHLQAISAEQLLRTTLPMHDRQPGSAEDDVAALWVRALELSYATELRAEGNGRAAALVAAHRDYYTKVAAALLPLAVSTRRALPFPAAVLWWWRRVFGKSLSLARLIKGLYTLDGALDYIVFKLERHSGRTIEISDAIRERPLTRIWGLFFRLYREGVFR